MSNLGDESLKYHFKPARELHLFSGVHFPKRIPDFITFIYKTSLEFNLKAQIITIRQ